ncbi:MAG: alpha/beta hydrolase [Longimicrobiales bacterium]|nr:alpha/beta hydrolase [Longimicrobiales bacterium]
MFARLHTQQLTASGATPERWLYLLHGIFGAGRNWNAVSRRVIEARPEWGVVAVDLRGHGRSGPGDPPHTVEACADDLRHLPSTGTPPASAVLGHSFGGKVATLFAVRSELRSLWIADSTPSIRAPGGSAWQMIEALARHPGPFRDREEGIAAVRDEGFADGVAQWMGTNLERGADEAWRWRIDLALMRDLLLDFFDRDTWPALEATATKGTAVHLLRATESSVISPDDVERWEALATRGLPLVRTDLAAGHWMNADAPDAVADALVSGL